MIRLVNRAGGDTWVHETRLGEYLAAGYQLAAPPQATQEREPDPPPQKPAKKTARKR